jgi:RecA-family ATPase
MLLFGDPKVGKSYAALQLACCLVSGQEWLGFQIPLPQQVAYVQLDTPRTLWADRVGKLAASGHCIEKVHFADRETLDTHPFDILEPAHFKKLATDLAGIQPGVVIVDTLRESHSADENDSTEMQEAISHLDAALKPAAMILVSHARKVNPQTGYNLMSDNRGSNYVVGRMDAIIRFSEKALRVSSRTLEEHSIKVDRLDDGTWELLKNDETRGFADDLINTYPGVSTRELAKLLKERAGIKSESACRAIIRRRISARR